MQRAQHDSNQIRDFIGPRRTEFIPFASSAARHWKNGMNSDLPPDGDGH
jgi:hypothetical protein